MLTLFIFYLISLFFCNINAKVINVTDLASSINQNKEQILTDLNDLSETNKSQLKNTNQTYIDDVIIY